MTKKERKKKTRKNSFTKNNTDLIKTKMLRGKNVFQERQLISVFI